MQNVTGARLTRSERRWLEVRGTLQRSWRRGPLRKAQGLGLIGQRDDRSRGDAVSEQDRAVGVAEQHRQ
jgi:hypothetical protein